MMKITGLSHLFKWENLHNWWLTKYFFAPLYLNSLVQTYAPSRSLRSASSCGVILKRYQITLTDLFLDQLVGMTSRSQFEQLSL